jgi:hypothetical protein
MTRFSPVYTWLLTFTISLALVVGWRLPADSRPVVAGVLAGVTASIPTSLLVAWLATRALDPRRRARRAWPPPPAPRVVVGEWQVAEDE